MRPKQSMGDFAREAAVSVIRSKGIQSRIMGIIFTKVAVSSGSEWHPRKSHEGGAAGAGLAKHIFLIRGSFQQALHATCPDRPEGGATLHQAFLAHYRRLAGPSRAHIPNLACPRGAGLGRRGCLHFRCKLVPTCSQLQEVRELNLSKPLYPISTL